MRTQFQSTLLATALGALTIGAAIASTAPKLPPVQKDGAVEYLSGGIGKDEAKAIEGASRHWPMTLEFTVKDKKRESFAADVAVAVRNASGGTALSATSDGPFLLARLKPGTYSVDATYAGKTLHERVVVKHGLSAKAVFVWPMAGAEKHS